MATTPVETGVTPSLELLAARPRSLRADVAEELRSLVRYSALLRYLVSSSFRTETANTVLGYVWWVLDPLLLAVVYVVFLRILLRGSNPTSAVDVFAAVVAWQFFSKAVAKSISTTVGKERTMREVLFPRTVLPLSTVLGQAIGFFLSLPMVVLVAIPFGIIPHPVVLLLLLVATVQVIFTLGFAFFLSAFNVFFRDTQKFISYLFRMWFFLSPALYPISRVPENVRGVYELNPFATFFPAYQDIVVKHQVPDLGALGVVAIVSFVLLAAGFLFFVRAQPWFAKLV